ncbi:MAG: YibE/F family protein [Clostridia bacterium]|nr:YibE/F family protein [Clostridia bacterium]
MKKILPLLFLLLIVAMMFYNQDKTEQDIIETSGKVLSVDNTEVLSTGFSNIGTQRLTIKLTKKLFQKEEVEAFNLLLGQSEYDELYKVDDRVIVAIKQKQGMILQCKVISKDRDFWLWLMVLILGGAVILYAGFIGVRALLSFLISIVVIWFVLIKGLLSGFSPVLLTVITVILLSGVIIFLVTGFNRKGLTAFLGTIAGLLVTMIFTMLFGSRMGFLGMTQPFAQTLLVNGYFDLNLLEIFYAAIILGASGAAMDISVDIAASMDEIFIHKSNICRKELIQSGFVIGRQVIGTMTTTLLLAYSGSYLTLLMLFMAKNTSTIQMLNMKIVASEIMRTLMGSIGLITVAPLTALIGGLIIVRKEEIENQNNSDDISAYRRNIVV